MLGGEINGTSYLKNAALTLATSEQYSVALKKWMAGCGDLPLDSAERIDETMVEWMNQRYLRGAECWEGEKLLAAVMHNFPD